MTAMFIQRDLICACASCDDSCKSQLIKGNACELYLSHLCIGQVLHPVVQATSLLSPHLHYSVEALLARS